MKAPQQIFLCEVTWEQGGWTSFLWTEMSFSSSVHIMTITELHVKSLYDRVGLKKETRQNYKECCRETGISSNKNDTWLSAITGTDIPMETAVHLRCVHSCHKPPTSFHFRSWTGSPTQQISHASSDQTEGLERGRLWTEKLRCLVLANLCSLQQWRRCKRQPQLNK